MRKFFFWLALFTYIQVFASIFVSMSAVGFAQSSRTQISSSPFTHDEIAVYQAFLADYGRASGETLNVADLTDILQPDEGDYAGCMNRFAKSAPINVVHRITPQFAAQNHLHLVDRKTHKVDDPEDAMLIGQSVENATEAGFRSGVLTLSQVIFDKNHKRAALHYSFVCGRLCAHSETVVYERSRGAWKASGQSCGYGIS